MFRCVLTVRRCFVGRVRFEHAHVLAGWRSMRLAKQAKQGLLFVDSQKLQVVRKDDSLDRQFPVDDDLNRRLDPASAHQVLQRGELYAFGLAVPGQEEQTVNDPEGPDPAADGLGQAETVAVRGPGAPGRRSLPIARLALLPG